MLIDGLSDSVYIRGLRISSPRTDCMADQRQVHSDLRAPARLGEAGSQEQTWKDQEFKDKQGQ
jgi:hypothetical protein